MPKITTDGNSVEYLVERLDGGLNTKDSPSQIGPYESPDCLNVVFDDQGSVACRNGSKILNTQAIGSAVIDHGTSYNGTMIVACGGSLYRMSGTTFVTIPSAQSVFTPGVKLSYIQYQGLLFMSDGTSAYKYAAESRFHQMGIAVPGSAGNTATSAGNVAAGTYYYKVAYVNTQAVEGQLGTASSGVTLVGSTVVGLSSVPVGAASQGVDQRYIYRSNSGASGSYLRIGSITDNSTTTSADNIGVGAETVSGVVDGTAPTGWTTAVLHKDIIFFDDSSNRSLIRYTNYTNPYISEALNFRRVNTSSGKLITRLEVIDDFVAAMLNDNETWAMDIVDPSDDTAWVGPVLAPANYGILNKLGATRVPNGLLFIGKKNGRITGFHIMSGLSVLSTADSKLRTESISEKIEPTILAIDDDDWSKMALFTYNNRVYCAFATVADSNINKHILWLDINRIGTEGQPGSWSLWSNLNAGTFWEHNGLLYMGSSVANGYVYQLELDATYADNGAAIDSYWWSREEGMGESLENYQKDFRKENLWFGTFGAYQMTARYRMDGDTGSGNSQNVNLTPGGALWGTMVWGTGTWGGGKTNNETRLNIGPASGKRIQLRFDNQNTVNQGFKVHRLSIQANMRSRR